MEEEATQPGISSSPFSPRSYSYNHPAFAYTPDLEATQIVIDPRRLGEGNSGFDERDLADIICILHPASKPAYLAAAQIHDHAPQHTMSIESDVKIRENNGTHEEIDDFELAAQGFVSCDIVLRLSANVKSVISGFCFGRNTDRCDFVMGHQDEVKRISNIHFRIYLNEHGVIMLEDQSTNGTAVDGHLLRAREKENGKDYRHTLQQGSVILITMPPTEGALRFVVRIPQRDDESDMEYTKNVETYLLRVANAKLDRQLTAGGAHREPLNLFPNANNIAPPNTSLSSSRKYVKEWKGGKKYNKVGTIGKGAFATVYKVTAKFDGIPFAAKELEKRRFMKNNVLDQKVDMELNIMRKAKHPNIVQFIEYVDWDDFLYIIMEYVPEGDLGSLISKHGPLHEATAKIMGVQLLDALKYLHDNFITHRDVKPDNILISSLEPFRVKLTDFGLSKMIDSEGTFLRTFCGTLLYCAPEVYSEYREYNPETNRRDFRGMDKRLLPPQRYGHAVDIWSLGGVLFYALCSNPPYPAKTGVSYQELLNQIMTTPLDIRPLQTAGVSENGIRFVRIMLHTRPEHRATIWDLELNSWLTGDDGLVTQSLMSPPNDDVDLVGGGFVNENLEQGASQLSIHEPGFDDTELLETRNGSDLTEVQQLDIPSSFDTSDEKSNGNESYAFLRNPRDHAANGGRLFGEVNISAFGSSGAIPLDLNLPVPTYNHQTNTSMDTSEESGYPQSEPTRGDSHLQSPRSPQRRASDGRAMPNMMLPPPPPQTSLSIESSSGIDPRAARSSSLMGAESMVGHLNMHSPSVASPPAVTSPAADTRDNNLSLRRPREESETDEEDTSWFPSDLPPKKRRKSTREIELEVQASTFWDPKDRSTHHRNYPRMKSSDYHRLEEWAASKGESFKPGQKTFEQTMQSFRSSRSPSLEPEATTRATSEPIEGRRMMMKRDDRKLSAETIPDSVLPSTAHGSNKVSSPDTLVHENPQPVVGNDFQPPKRILAKLHAVRDSCLPALALNVTEPVTSWGRGELNTVRYTNGQEIRIPKYAFKLLLFKSGFYVPGKNIARSNEPWNDKDQDMAFYISSKATTGIWVNGVNVPSHERQQASTVSKYWGELRHGDIVTVWQHDIDKRQFTGFRFECYWGKSKEPRKEGEVFELSKGDEMLSEMDHVCLAQEKDFLQERTRQQEEQKKMNEQVKEEQKAMIERQIRQSFMSASGH